MDIETGIKWLKNTFMFVRMKNDQLNLKSNNFSNKNSVESEIQIENQLKIICLKIFKDLASIDLIEFTAEEFVKVKKLGEKMCKNYVLFETMKNIMRIKDNSEETILDIISNSAEFIKYRSKMEDRKILNNFNKDNNIKYKVKGIIDTFNKKAFLLLQAAFACLPLEPWELRRQQNEIIQRGLRILNCIKQLFKSRDDAKGIVQIILIKKIMNQKMWTTSELFTKQFPKIGEKIAKNLVRGGISNFDKLKNENPRKIEVLAGKSAPFGNILIDMAKSIPNIILRFDIKKLNKTSNESGFKLILYYKLLYKKQIILEDFDPFTCYFIIVSDSKNKLLHKKKIKPTATEKELFSNISTGIIHNSFPITIYIICEKFIGLDSSVVIENENDNVGFLSNFLNLNNKTLLDYKNITFNTDNNSSINISEKNFNSTYNVDEGDNPDFELDKIIQEIIQEEDNEDNKKEKNKNKKGNNQQKKNIIKDNKNSGNLLGLINNMKNFEKTKILTNSENIVNNLNNAKKESYYDLTVNNIDFINLNNNFTEKKEEKNKKLEYLFNYSSNQIDPINQTEKKPKNNNKISHEENIKIGNFFAENFYVCDEYSFNCKEGKENKYEIKEKKEWGT